MSTALHFDGAQQPEICEAYANQDVRKSELPALSGASYVIGKTLGEVWNAIDMDFDELMVASAMCFSALGDGTAASALTLDEVVKLSRLNSRSGRRALEKLVGAGFVKVVRVGNAELRYELRFPVNFSSN